MCVCLKECKDAELVRSSVPIARKNDIYENTQPETEHCSDGIAPQPNTAVDGSQKMIVPVVVSMTKYLFVHYRLQMYAYLNNSLRSGMLKRIVGFSFTNRTINREVCTFKGVNYWRMDRLNFWADVSVTLLLSTAEGKREWCGYLCFWFSAEQPGPLTGTIEELTSVKDGPERSGMTLLSPFLIPYFTAAKIDMEAENIWAACIPGALDHPELRKAEMLAGAMGLSILHLPLHKHEEVDGILFLVDDQIEIAEKGKQPEIREIPANTIVINTSNIKKEYSDFNILHECIHYYEHYLFFRLQEMHHNDIWRMETQEIEHPENGEKTSNPVYWMEKQADRGAYGLLMPLTFMRGLLAEKCRMLNPYAHEGEKYEQIGLAIAEELSLPHFRVRARMIQMGHVHAKGALNYVDRHRIRPYSFDETSLRKDEHTFNISRITAGGLYEKNADFRELLDSGKYVYANGHIVRNDPRFAEQTPYGYVLTPLALQRIDLCCLRFIRIYEQKNVSRYIFGRMNYDPDYVKRTLFYLEDLINERELDEIDAEQQFKRNFPDSFLEAFDMLMKKNGDTRETIAEKLNVNCKSLQRWLKEPDRKITADFIVLLALTWRLPDWISTLLLDRAYIRLSESNRRHLALQYILKVLWSEGVEKANAYLTARKLDCLSI